MDEEGNGWPELEGLWEDMSLPLPDARTAPLSGATPAALPHQPFAAVSQAQGSLQPVWAHQAHQPQQQGSQGHQVLPGAPQIAVAQPAQAQEPMPAPSRPAAPQRKRSQRSMAQQQQHTEGSRRGAGRPDVSQQVSELEQVYQDKLRALQALTATHHELAEKAWVMEQVLASRDVEAVRAAELASGTINPFEPLGLTVQQLQAASPQEMLDRMKALTLELGQELMAYELSGVTSPKLERLQQGLMQACKYVGIVSPQCMLYTSMHLDSVVMHASNQAFAAAHEQMPHPPQDHWHRVALALKLDARTMARAHILHQLAHGWHQRIQAERRALTAALSQCSSQHAAASNPQHIAGAPAPTPSPAGSLSCRGDSGGLLPARSGTGLTTRTSGADSVNNTAATPAAAGEPLAAGQQVDPAAATSHRSAAGTPAMWPQPGSLLPHTCASSTLRCLYTEAPPEEPILDRLSANLEKERRVVMLVGDVLWTRLLSQLEACRAMVHSYPWVPDDLMILHSISTLHTQHAASAAATGGVPATQP